MMAGDRGVEGADFLVEAFPQAVVGLADHERGLTHH
jgi:hypothetical protein